MELLLHAVSVVDQGGVVPCDEHLSEGYVDGGASKRHRVTSEEGGDRVDDVAESGPLPLSGCFLTSTGSWGTIGGKQPSNVCSGASTFLQAQGMLMGHAAKALTVRLQHTSATSRWSAIPFCPSGCDPACLVHAVDLGPYRTTAKYVLRKMAMTALRFCVTRERGVRGSRYAVAMPPLYRASVGSPPFEGRTTGFRSKGEALKALVFNVLGFRGYPLCEGGMTIAHAVDVLDALYRLWGEGLIIPWSPIIQKSYLQDDYDVEEEVEQGSGRMGVKFTPPAGNPARREHV